MGRIALVSLLLLLAVGAVIWRARISGGANGPADMRQDIRVREPENPAATAPKVRARRAVAGEGRGAEQPTAASRLQEAWDAEDLDRVRKLAREVRASADAEVRQTAVDALGWFGLPAMTDLTPFLNDADTDVAQSAFAHWDASLDEVEDETVRLGVAREALKTLRDPDMLEAVALRLRAAADEAAAVRAVVDVLRGVKADSPAAAAVRDAYEFITGDEFESEEGAAEWIVAQAAERGGIDEE